MSEQELNAVCQFKHTYAQNTAKANEHTNYACKNKSSFCLVFSNKKTPINKYYYKCVLP